MSNDSFKDSFTLSFDSWSTDRRNCRYPFRISSSAQNINCLKYQISVHQTVDRIRVPNKANNVAIFDHLDVRKYRVDIDGILYPRDGVNVDCGLNDYDDQNQALKRIYKE